MSKFPAPKPSVADPDLWRPTWTSGEKRDPSKLWLDKNENGDPALAEIVRHALAAAMPETGASYPDCSNLYRKLAKHTKLPAENLILSAGSDGIIRSVFEAFIEPGDVVIHTQPTFAMYAVYGQMYGAATNPLSYRPSNRGPVLTVENIVESIKTSAPRLVCLPNPDSPTGTYFAAADMRNIIETAGDAGAVMLVDEAYYPFHAETVMPWVTDYPHLVVTRSTGKAWGMAGYRIGYGAASSEMTAILHKVRPMYETNTVAVAVFENMLDHADEMLASVARLEEGKAGFLVAMENLGFTTLQGKGNFLHVNFGSRAPDIHQGLADLVYYRKDFKEPCLRGFSRFSAATPKQFAPLIAKIQAISKKG
jgi:histidinol-phosphate aminotransferase